MPVLYTFRCFSCNTLIEEFAPVGAKTATCSSCGSEAVRRFSAPLTCPSNFGRPMAEHSKDRRLAPAERERREWWNRTRLKEHAPEDKTPKPTIFT